MHSCIHSLNYICVCACACVCTCVYVCEYLFTVPPMHSFIYITTLSRGRCAAPTAPRAVCTSKSASFNIYI